MLFVDIWQSPILGFTHYETCLMHYSILNNSRELYVFGLENNAMLDLRDTFGMKPYSCLNSVDLNFFIEILGKYDEFWFNTFTEHWFLDEKKQCLYRTMIESPISSRRLV